MTKQSVTNKPEKAKAVKPVKVVPIITAKDLLDVQDKSGKAILLATDKAVKATQSINKAFQVIAVSAIVHLGTHKDIRVIRNLFERMPESLNINSMKAFFDKYASVKFDDEGQVHYDKTKPVQLALALENAWWLAKGQSVYKPFDFQAELARLITRAESRLEKPKDGDSIDKAQLANARKLLKAQNAAKAEVTAKAA